MKIPFLPRGASLLLALACLFGLGIVQPCVARERSNTVPARGLEAAEKQKTSVGFVDFRLLLLEHPLMKRFDPTSRRFLKTVSAFAPDLEAHRQACSEELQEVRSRLKTLETEARPLLRGGGASAREAYSAYWKKRAFLQDEEAVLQNAVASAAMTGNYHIGMTSEDSLIPIVTLINRHLRDLVEEVKARNRLDLVLDISGFAPETGLFTVPAIRVENQHWLLWDGKPLTRELLLAWREQAWSSIPGLASGKSPILAGALDLRVQAVELLRTWSNPSLKGR